jgi:Ca2+-binding EF-hand superfamily protein
VKATSHSASESKPAKDKQKSYRFKTAKERLPAGLPGWFTSKDANGDGQVSMSEYSKSWTESQAAEFKRYDKDNDGIITAEEAAKK